MKASDTNLAESFHRAFPGGNWVKSTWHANNTVWTKALKVPELIERYERAGHTSDGEWSKLRREVNGK